MASTAPGSGVVDAHAITDALGGTWRGSYGSARCPSHDDRRPSLSVKDAGDDKVLVRCHAGCAQDAIIDALRERGLWPPNGDEPQRFDRARLVMPAASKPEAPEAAPQPEPSATPSTVRHISGIYDYQDEYGAVLFQAVRYEIVKDGTVDKTFRQRRPTGSGGWAWNLDGVRHVPYRLPALAAADPATTVFVVEGEKDADRLAALGQVATTNPMGALKWRPEYGEYLRGRPVVVLEDNDDTGRKHAADVAAQLAGVAASVLVLGFPELPEKGDVSDWLDAGGTVEGLHARVASSTPPPPRMVSLTSADLLLGDQPAIPWLIAAPPDEFGEIPGGLLAERETFILGADSGAGKTWLLADLIRTAAMGEPWFGHFRLARPLKIMLVDEESSLWLLRQRWAALLRGAGVDPAWFAREVFDRNIVIYQDQGFSFDDERAVYALHEAAQRFGPDMVLCDTLARVHRRPENDNSEIAALFEDKIKPFKRSLGCCLGFAHHLRKASKDAPNDPGAMLRGAGDLKAQLDQFWYLRGKTGNPRGVFEHDKCRAMPELPQFGVLRERLPDGGVRITHQGATAAAATAAEQNGEVLFRFIVERGQPMKDDVVEFGKSRGMSLRSVEMALRDLMNEERIDRGRVGKQAFFWATEGEE